MKKKYIYTKLPKLQLLTEIRNQWPNTILKKKDQIFGRTRLLTRWNRLKEIDQTTILSQTKKVQKLVR